MSKSKKSEFLQIAFNSRPVLQAYAYSILKDWGLAQDVFQDAVISMNEKIEEINADSPLKWLKSVIKNKAIDIIRKNERSKSHNEQLSILLEEKFDQFLNNEALEKYRDKEKALKNCMAKLPENSRKVIIDFYKFKLSCEKIGELYKRSTNAIRLVLSRSRADLRYCVKKQLEKS